MTDLVFTNRFTNQLSADPLSENHTPSEAAYSRVLPTPRQASSLLAWSADAAKLLAFPANRIKPIGPRFFPAIVNCPAWILCRLLWGHQFGHWAGQLRRFGRAITLVKSKRRRLNIGKYQLKGRADPYSRHADGRAVLRSSPWEFVCSEQCII